MHVHLRSSCSTILHAICKMIHYSEYYTFNLFRNRIKYKIKFHLVTIQGDTSTKSSFLAKLQWEYVLHSYAELGAATSFIYQS